MTIARYVEILDWFFNSEGAGDSPDETDATGTANAVRESIGDDRSYRGPIPTGEDDRAAGTTPNLLADD